MYGKMCIFHISIKKAATDNKFIQEIYKEVFYICAVLRKGCWVFFAYFVNSYNADAVYDGMYMGRRMRWTTYDDVYKIAFMNS